MSEDSEDSQGGIGEEKEQRLYWKEVERKVEVGISDGLENARVARHAEFEKQVKDLGPIVEQTSSDGEVEGEVAEQRRTRRKEREVEMEEKRTKKEEMHREYTWSRAGSAGHEAQIRGEVETQKADEADKQETKGEVESGSKEGGSKSSGSQRGKEESSR
eukprot:2748140-Pleurochrysis_carterae.AAC.1